MTSQLLMLKKIMSTILHHTSFFNAKFKFFPQDLPNIFLVLQGVFVISDNAFGCDEPTYNTSPVWKLSLLTQFSGFTTLHLLFIFMYLFTYFFFPFSPLLVFVFWQLILFLFVIRLFFCCCVFLSLFVFLTRRFHFLVGGVRFNLLLVGK